MGAGAIAIFIGTLLVALIFTPSDPHDRGKVGLDFIAFYTAGNFVRDGRSADLYDIAKVHQFQGELAKRNGVDLGAAVGPWWNPPFYAWVFVPIAKLPYPDALRTWVWFNIACAGISAILLCRIIATAAPKREDFGDMKIASGTGRMPVAMSQVGGGWKTWLLVPVLMALSTPFIHALSHGQNTCTSLLLLTVVVVFWRKEKALAAGIVAGLLFYKPQLAAALGLVLVVSLGWRSLLGMGITGAILLVATLALPGSLHDFLVQMPRNIHYVQCDVPYMWDRHVTFKAFWRLLLQGTAAGEPRIAVTVLSTLCSGAVAAGLFWGASRVKISSRINEEADAAGLVDTATRRDRLIAATIAATPLLMPFYFDYDQLLLVIPAVLLGADFLRRDRSMPIPRADVWLMRIWPMQYVWMMLNSDVALTSRLHLGTLWPTLSISNPLYHVNLGVWLLSGVTTLLIVRTIRDRDTAHPVARDLTEFERHLAAA
jgi:hypothetical protein